MKQYFWNIMIALDRYQNKKGDQLLEAKFQNL
jgi:hypothetical protein